MASRSGLTNRIDDACRSGEAGEGGRRIDQLEERVTALEEELRSNDSDSTYRRIIDRKPAGAYRTLIQLMVDKAADMVFLLGSGGRILYANEVASKVLGYTHNEFQSMTVFDINQVHRPENWEEHEESLKRHGSLTFENVLKAKDGHLIPVEISANYIRLGGDEYNYSFVRDITERKQAEVELQKYRKHLEDLVKERTQKLEDVNTRLQADIAQRTKAEEGMIEAKHQAELYLDLMGHDINNMHQVALGYLELARDMPPEESRQFLDKPVEVLKRSARLIQNVRKLQKVHEGVFQQQDIDVCQVLVDVLRELGATPDKTVRLNLNGLEHCQVRANELLHDVFANLVGNAIKHTGRKADILVDLNIVDEKGTRYYRTIVEDNGPGIPDDSKETVFNRISKGAEKAKGMGLGLYLVRSLVDSYGGRVWAEDRVPGDHTKGARFVVLLPTMEK